MEFRFILGRSGTGKTSYCIKAIVEALLAPAGGGSNQPLIFLVPEQATYQAERAILSDKRIAGYNRLQVLSFDRLQFLLLGKNSARPALSRIGQQMVVHRLLRANKDKLEIFGRSAEWPGLASRMANTIAEMHQYAKTPEDIEHLLRELEEGKDGKLTAEKFADIGLVFREYLKFIEGRFIDPDVQLTRACQAVVKADFVRGAKLWVDGFAGFTASELAILSELLRVVVDAQIALCLDPRDFNLAYPETAILDETSLFYPTQRTYVELAAIIKSLKLHLSKPILLEGAGRFSDCPQLGHIERHIFKPNPARIAASGDIRIVSAPNERAEVQFVARQVIELVREKGYRYRDIAVIASDIDRYQHYIKAYFDDYDISFFIDKRKPLSQHSIVQLICAALQAVTGGFSNSDIFTYLKTDLASIERTDVDVLENYCLAFGINAGDWQTDKQWDFAGEDNEDFDDRQIDRIRLKAIGPLLKLNRSFYGENNVTKALGPEEFARIIFDFLGALDVRETLGSWIEEATEHKDYAAIEEHRQFYDSLVNVFDELVEVFAGQTLAAEDYAAIVNSAFSQMTLAFIPPALDEVLVGSIERSRHPDLKAVFLIGATQRQFPAPINFDSILSDDDRCVAERADFRLGAATDQKLAERQYLAYIAFTRPSEMLCITYPAADRDGSAVPRSQFIDELELLFEGLKEESISDRQIDIEKVGNRTELVDLLCSRLGRDAPAAQGDDGNQLDGLLGDISSDRELAHLGAIISSAINYDNRAQLDGDVVKELFGERIKSSATRLGDFAGCPYRHFARHILELKERKEFKFEPLDLGTFYHRILDALLKRVNDKKRDLVTIRDNELLILLREEISRFKNEDPFTSNFIRHSRHNAYLIASAAEVLEDCVLAIAQMVRAGNFRPVMSEVSFGKIEGARDALGEYGLTLSDSRVLSLDGKIDRLDFAEIEGGKLAIVFDYKRREQSFGWSGLYYGLDMQLPIYLLAVRNASRSKIKSVIGAFYMPVEAEIGQTAFDELETKKEKFHRKAKGIFNGEFFQHIDNTTNAGWSRFYNFFISKENGQYGRYNDSGVLNPADFENFLRFTEAKVVQLAEEIISGKIDVRPYRIGTRSPCTYCKFRAVCRFDWQINDYNLLESLNKLRALEKIGVPGG